MIGMVTKLRSQENVFKSLVCLLKKILCATAMKAGKKTEKHITAFEGESVPIIKTFGQDEAITFPCHAKDKLDSSSSYDEHKCPECSKDFGTSGKLLQHMFVHSGEKPFRCSHCEKSFSSKFKLMRHTLIHSSERQYQCTYCERCFHRKDHLKNHLQVHNPNKKVHRCDQCNKEYNSRLSYRKHIAIHAAEAGDLNCKVCGKNFDTSEEILYHLKVHAGSRTVKNPNEKKFKCDQCERRFFTRKDVKRHLVVHTGRRDFLCQFCPQRFGRKDHLVRHIKKSHNSSIAVSMAASSSSGSSGHGGMGNAAKTEGSNLATLSVASAPPPPQTLMVQPQSCVLLPRQLAAMATVPKIGFAKMEQGPLPLNLPLEFTPATLQPTSPFLASDFKSFEEIKIERCDDAVDSINPTAYDIAQLLNYVPIGPHAPIPNLSPASSQVTTASSTLSSGQPPTSSTAPILNSLPRFSQAFQ